MACDHMVQIADAFIPPDVVEQSQSIGTVPVHPAAAGDGFRHPRDDSAVMYPGTGVLHGGPCQQTIGLFPVRA